MGDGEARAKEELRRQKEQFDLRRQQERELRRGGYSGVGTGGTRLSAGFLEEGEDDEDALRFESAAHMRTALAARQKKISKVSVDSLSKRASTARAQLKRRTTKDRDASSSSSSDDDVNPDPPPFSGG